MLLTEFEKFKQFEEEFKEEHKRNGITLTNFMLKKSQEAEQEKLKKLIKEEVGMELFLEFDEELHKLLESHNIHIALLYRRDNVSEEVENIEVWIEGPDSEFKSEMQEKFSDYEEQLEYTLRERLNEEVEIQTGKKWMNENETYGQVAKIKKEDIKKYS